MATLIWLALPFVLVALILGAFDPWLLAPQGGFTALGTLVMIGLAVVILRITVWRR